MATASIVEVLLSQVRPATRVAGRIYGASLLRSGTPGSLRRAWASRGATS